jgi:hypothetical protein
MTENIKKQDYKSLLDSVSTLIEEARRKAVKQVRVFSERKLEMMRKFYITYHHISQTLSAKSSQLLTGETQALFAEFHTPSE